MDSGLTWEEYKSMTFTFQVYFENAFMIKNLVQNLSENKLKLTKSKFSAVHQRDS